MVIKISGSDVKFVGAESAVVEIDWVGGSAGEFLDDGAEVGRVGLDKGGVGSGKVRVVVVVAVHDGVCGRLVGVGSGSHGRDDDDDDDDEL